MTPNKLRRAAPDDLLERIAAALVATERAVEKTHEAMKQSEIVLDRARQLRRLADRKHHILP
jgi:hypothetical protein